jgi:hypothetical protein
MMSIDSVLGSSKKVVSAVVTRQILLPRNVRVLSNNFDHVRNNFVALMWHASSGLFLAVIDLNGNFFHLDSLQLFSDSQREIDR